MPSMSGDKLLSGAAGGPGVMRQNLAGVGTNKRQRFEGGQTKDKHGDKFGDNKRTNKRQNMFDFHVCCYVLSFVCLFLSRGLSFFVSMFVPP